MKSLNICILTLLSLCALVSCDSESTELSNHQLTTPTDAEERFNRNKQLIVLAAPSIYNEYYASVFDQIIDFQANMVNTIDGKDEAVILVDKDTRPYFDGKVSPNHLIEANMEDIWIRDFSPVVAGKQVKFNFLPDYLSVSDANAIDNAFEDWFYDAQLQYGSQSKLILDGGNVVDNGKGRVIVTDRFLYDNPQLTYNQAVRKLKTLLNAKQVAIIPESPGDATGHADGMVMWATKNKILLHEMQPRKQRQVIRELKYAFPGVKVVVVPDYYQDDSWQGFTTACNIFVNSLVTERYIYMPTFGTGHDQEMLHTLRSHTNKTVVPIPAEDVCFMGGNVRCLSWQVKGKNADWILELAE